MGRCWMLLIWKSAKAVKSPPRVSQPYLKRTMRRSIESSGICHDLKSPLRNAVAPGGTREAGGVDYPNLLPVFVPPPSKPAAVLDGHVKRGVGLPEPGAPFIRVPKRARDIIIVLQGW